MKGLSLTKSHATPSISSVQPDNQQSRSGTSAETTSLQVTSSEPTFRHCYGKDPEDRIRLSMGSLTQDQLTQSPNYINTPRK